MRKYAFVFMGLLIASSCASRRAPGVVDESYIHRYGVEVPQSEWKVRGESGTIVTKMKDGVVISRTYDLGVLHGDSTHTYPHSTTLQKKEIFENGELMSVICYDVFGIPEKEMVYRPDGACKTTSWYQNGSPKDEELERDGKIYHANYFSPSGQLESKIEEGLGTRLVRTRKGELLAREEFQGGELAVRTKLYPTGIPEEIATFSKGKFHGVRKTFLPEGEPLSVEAWENGRQQGLTSIFQAGERIAEVPYFAGKKHGTEKRYRDGEILVQELHWVHGVHQGPTITYFGDAVTTEWFFQDRHVTKPSYDLLTRPAVQ